MDIKSKLKEIKTKQIKQQQNDSISDIYTTDKADVTANLELTHSAR
ncbi:hypothetical protein [Alteribacillus sp. HJP-4]